MCRIKRYVPYKYCAIKVFRFLLWHFWIFILLFILIFRGNFSFLLFIYLCIINLFTVFLFLIIFLISMQIFFWFLFGWNFFTMIFTLSNILLVLALFRKCLKIYLFFQFLFFNSFTFWYNIFRSNRVIKYVNNFLIFMILLSDILILMPILEKLWEQWHVQQY